jgi:predicted membrane protein
MADNTKENVNLPTYDKLKENIIEKKKEKIVKSYNNSIQDEVKRITKGTDRILYFNNSEEKRTFKKIINELYKKDNINYNDVKDIVESNYNTRSISYNDEYIQNIKKELRNKTLYFALIFSTISIFIGYSIAKLFVQNGVTTNDMSSALGINLMFKYLNVWGVIISVFFGVGAVRSDFHNRSFQANSASNAANQLSALGRLLICDRI